jgi:hypothetical protein
MRLPPGRTWKSWAQMKQRCQNPKAPDYARYGGRGIRVCERWQKFANFLVDMGSRPEGMTLDRKDTNGNYEPGNCRWATPAEQQQNMRSTKLDWTAVTRIRALCEAGNSQTDVAQLFGVSSSLISRVVNRKMWR